MITMLGLFIVVTYVEQRLIVLPNTAGKKELYGSNPCLYFLSKKKVLLSVSLALYHLKRISVPQFYEAL